MIEAVYALPRYNPDHPHAGGSSNIGCAFPLYFAAIWQRKPAIGLLTSQYPDKNPRASAWIPKCYVQFRVGEPATGAKMRTTRMTGVQSKFNSEPFSATSDGRN